VHSFLKLCLREFSDQKRGVDSEGSWPAPYRSLSTTAENHTGNLQLDKLLEELSRDFMAAWPALCSHTGYIQYTTNTPHTTRTKDQCFTFHIFHFDSKAALEKLFCAPQVYLEFSFSSLQLHILLSIQTVFIVNDFQFSNSHF